MTHASICRKCRRTCKQMAWAKIVSCPAFIKKEGGENSKEPMTTRRHKENAQEGAASAPDGAGTEKTKGERNE